MKAPIEGPHTREKESEAERPRRGEKIGEDWEVRVFRLAAPMATKRAEDGHRVRVEVAGRVLWPVQRMV